MFPSDQPEHDEVPSPRRMVAITSGFVIPRSCNMQVSTESSATFGGSKKETRKARPVWNRPVSEMGGRVLLLQSVGLS